MGDQMPDTMDYLDERAFRLTRPKQCALLVFASGERSHIRPNVIGFGEIYL